MKNNKAVLKRIPVVAIILIILLSIIIAVPGCGKNGRNAKGTGKTDSRERDPKDITAGYETYASLDSSYITKLADYRSMVLEKDLTVSDAEINDEYIAEISEISARNDFSEDPAVIDPSFAKLAALTPADAVTKDGDFICFDYSGKLDGEPLSGGIASYQFTWLGSGHFIPGFEEQISGHKTGETFPITVTFPESYPANTDLENKEVVFDITVRYIFPGITDESVAVLREYEEISFNETKLSDDDIFEPEYGNAAEYVEYVKSGIRSSKESSFEYNFQGLIMQKLYEESEYGVVPQDAIDSFKSSVEQVAASYGVPVETYLLYVYGASISDFDELARYSVCEGGLFAAVIKAENMMITAEEYDVKVREYVEEYGYDSVSEIESLAGKENIFNAIYVEKIFDLLKECVKIEVKE